METVTGRTTARTHLKLVIASPLLWIAFWLVGLPSYYQQYSTGLMIGYDAILLPSLMGLWALILKRVERERRLSFSLWAAFYFTVPFALFDWVYCGVYLGDGLGFLTKYWYLTVYYFVLWGALPACAMWLRGRETQGRAT